MTKGSPGLLRGRSLVLLALFVAAAVAGMATNALDRGEKNLGGSELRQIQAAVLTMMTHNGITSIPNPVAEPTSDLGAFPDAVTSPTSKGLLEGDKPGYVLFEHDHAADGDIEATVSYVRFPDGRWTYTAARDGTVTQWERASGG